MQELDDNALLREYVERGSDEAFATLVTRHVHKVYSVALRHTGNPDTAGEITQAVFVILAGKARGLVRHKFLAGWLCETARLTAVTFLRSEIRRGRREQEAQMQTVLNESESDVWPQIAPLLDAAMAGLNEADRHAVVLRFFDGKTMREVGAALGANEDAAKKRVNRALEKLRKYFRKHGVASTPEILAGTISANSVQTAPVLLAKTATAVALAKGATASISTLTLIKGAFKAMTWAKLKFACSLGTAVLLASSVVTVAVIGADDNGGRYQIEGDLMYHTANYDTVRNFILTVNGRNWAIHLTDPKMQAAGIKYQEVVCLNESVYRYDFYGKPDPGGAINSGSAEIFRGNFPVEDGTFANFVWVGLASASYFAGATNGDVVSLVNRPRDARTYKDKAIWQLIDYPPYLPESIDYYNKGTSILLRPGVILHQFENGWKSGEVRVLQETNVNGDVFPLVYTYEQFRPNLNSSTSSNDVEHQLLVTVNVRSIRLDSVPDVLPPKTEGTTAVGETRFPNNTNDEQTDYFSTANRLPEKPEAEAVKEYNQQQKRPVSTTARHHLKLEQPSSHKWIWLSTVVTLFAVVVIAGLMKAKRRD